MIVTSPYSYVHFKNLIKLEVKNFRRFFRMSVVLSTSRIESQFETIGNVKVVFNNNRAKGG